jgi:hypothetical protein
MSFIVPGLAGIDFVVSGCVVVWFWSSLALLSPNIPTPITAHNPAHATVFVARLLFMTL